MPVCPLCAVERLFRHFRLGSMPMKGRERVSTAAGVSPSQRVHSIFEHAPATLIWQAGRRAVVGSRELA